MRRRTAIAGGLTAGFALCSGLPARAAELPDDFTTAAGTLGGTLAFPADGERWPVVLIVPGSGPTDRDGNAPGLRTDCYRLLAAALAEGGVAALRYDKRGLGASAELAPDGSAVRFEDMALDAANWIANLRADGRFTRVSIVGHSEGSLLGMLAAQQSRVDAFVSIAGPGFPFAYGLRRQLATALAARPDLLATAQRITDELVAGRTVADVPPALDALYRPAVQP